MSTHFIWVPLQVSKRLLSTQCPHSQNVHFKRKFFPTNLILFFPRNSPIMYVSTSSDSGYRFLNICMFTIYRWNICLGYLGQFCKRNQITLWRAFPLSLSSAVLFKFGSNLRKMQILHHIFSLNKLSSKWSWEHQGCSTK